MQKRSKNHTCDLARQSGDERRHARDSADKHVTSADMHVTNGGIEVNVIDFAYFSAYNFGIFFAYVCKCMRKNRTKTIQMTLAGLQVTSADSHVTSAG